jgi:hypothetical protein
MEVGVPRTVRAARLVEGAAARSQAASRQLRGAVRLGVAAGALLLGTAGWLVPAGAAPLRPPSATVFATPPTPSSIEGHLLILGATTRKVSAWGMTDLTKLESSAAIVGNVSAGEAPDGAVEVVGRTSSGQLDLFTSVPGAASWSVSDVTALAKAPVAAGDPSVVVDGSSVTRVFYRTAGGHLDEVENDGRTASDPWFGSDLTELTSPTLSPTISGNPIAMAARGYATAVYARATDGDLVGFTLTSFRLHPWYYENISELSLGPSIKGAPAVVPAPDGLGLTAVYAVTPADRLVEFTDDNAGWHLWSARDVTAELDLPPVASSPTALPGFPTLVATATSSGRALVVTVPAVSLAGATVQDVSGMVRRLVAPTSTVSIAPGATGYVVAATTPAHHVLVVDVASTTAKTATASDATMQLLTEQLAGDSPTAFRVGGTTEVFVTSGGSVGLIARIVLAAEAEDQFHAEVVDTPANSDCNPFTASFGRGTTAGCPAGTASEQWCSDFSDWVWTVSGVPTNGIDGASKSFVTWGRAHGRFLKGLDPNPKVGDAVVWGTLNPLWGSHVGIVVGVAGNKIDVVSGNSGGYLHNSGVWDSGLFVPSSQSAQGDPIIGYVSPVPLAASSSS